MFHNFLKSPSPKTAENTEKNKSGHKNTFNNFINISHIQAIESIWKYVVFSISPVAKFNVDDEISGKNTPT